MLDTRSVKKHEFHHSRKGASEVVGCCNYLIWHLSI